MPTPSYTFNTNQQIKLSTDTNYEQLWATYHIRLVKGAYDELLKYPPVKEYVTNSSSLENGVRYDIPSGGVKLNEKTFSIEILIDDTTESDLLTHYDNFMTKYYGKLFYIKILSLNKVFKLVYKDSERRKTYRNGKATFVLKLTEPNPSDRT